MHYLVFLYYPIALRGRIYDLYCASAAGGDRDVSASFLDTSHVVSRSLQSALFGPVQVSGLCCKY